MKKGLVLGAVALLPTFAFAVDNLLTAQDKVGQMINSAVPMVLALVFIYFAWGVVKYVASGADEKGKEAAKGVIIYSIIIMAVIFGIWGLIQVVLGTFGAGNVSAPTISLPQ